MTNARVGASAATPLAQEHVSRFEPLRIPGNEQTRTPHAQQVLAHIRYRRVLRELDIFQCFETIHLRFRLVLRLSIGRMSICRRLVVGLPPRHPATPQTNPMMCSPDTKWESSATLSPAFYNTSWRREGI